MIVEIFSRDTELRDTLRQLSESGFDNYVINYPQGDSAYVTICVKTSEEDAVLLKLKFLEKLDVYSIPKSLKDKYRNR